MKRGNIKEKREAVIGIVLFGLIMLACTISFWALCLIPDLPQWLFILFFACGGGCVVLMIPALWVLPANMDWRLMAKPVNAINLLYLGLFASALCFLTWNRVVEILGAVKSSVYIYMIPVVTVVASAIILGERLTWISLAGILLTLCGVTISEYRKKTRKSGKKRLS